MKKRISFRRRGKRRGSKSLSVIIAVMLMLLLTVTISADAKLRPIVRSMAESQAKNLALRAIDSAVTDVLSKDNTNYDDLVSIKLNSDREIYAIQSQTVEINKLKAALSTAISKAIDSYDRKQIKIPIGTIIGGDLLSGRGPRINVYITLSSSTLVQISNAFESSGINQTRHQIILNVTAKVYIIMTGGNIATTVETNFVIAETVIVGTVPDMYVASQGQSTAEVKAEEKTEAAKK